MDKWSNKIVTGIFAGIISPLLAFYLFCFFSCPGENVIEILKRYNDRNVLTHVISLSVLINLPLFFGFLGVNRERSAQGIIGATIIYAFLIVVLKFL